MSSQDLNVLRHSCAHLLAMAVKNLFPSAQMAIGPVIENGFYYDFYYEKPWSLKDLEVIEAEMKSLSKKGYLIQRKTLSKAEAIQFFEAKNETYKVRLISDFSENEEITIYYQDNFFDLCRGPHVHSVSQIQHFKLTGLSGAYWKGDSRNEMLQRIYGTCWAQKSELKDYLKLIHEAQLRDHRKLGQELDYFHFQEEAPGAVFWHPKGWSLFQILINQIRKEQFHHGYIEINTPDMMDRRLWETSGHWEAYHEHMYTLQTEDQRVYALKPMSCPGALLYYNKGLKSYRNLPLRVAEFGKVHRYEPSGTLHGLMRVRHFTQDDAHIFCTQDQLIEECKKIIKLVLRVYSQFGFKDVLVSFATRPEKKIGTEESWDILENALAQALKEEKISAKIKEGEGAFYGPKLEFGLKDAIGREWQCGTLQVDLSLPERFKATYIDEEGKKVQPVLLHRALFGSLERFIGILIENYSGKLPFSISPVQMVILPVSIHQKEYVEELYEFLMKNKFRVEKDLSSEKINHKIRTHTLQKIPYMLIVGDKEKGEKKVNVRSLTGETVGVFSWDELTNYLEREKNVEFFK